MIARFNILLIFLLLLTCSIEVFTQGSKNPFDIDNRPSKELIPANSADSIFLQPPATETNDQPSKTNPFDVSHVPIQKEAVRKKTQRKKASYSDKSLDHTKSRKPSSVFDFKFWILLLSIVLFAVIFTLNPKKIGSLQRAVLNQNFQKSLARENNNGNNLFFLLLYILFALNIALLFYNYVDYQAVLNVNFKIYIYLTLIITGLYIGKHLFLGFMGFVFPVHKEMSIYSFSIKLFNAIVSLFLLIINVLIVLGPENWRLYLIYTGFIILGIFYIFRLFNGTIHASRLVSKHTFHFFLYLCTTEIAPLVIFYSLLIA